MEYLIFRTDIESKRKAKLLQPVFNRKNINDWSVDTEDIDKVLRVGSKGELTESDVIHLINEKGFQCEVLEG